MLSEHVYCVAIAFKMTERVEQWICNDFCINLEHCLQKLLRWFRRPQLWATGDGQRHHDNVLTHASCLMQSFLVKHQITQVTAPVQLIFGTLRLLVFPKTKIIFEREEISNHWRDSRKHVGAADGEWENCVRSQGACFEGAWGIIVLCTMFLVSCIFFDKCLHFLYYLAGYLLNRPHRCKKSSNISK